MKKGTEADLIHDWLIDDEHTRALEEQWIEGDLTNETAQSEFRANRSGRVSFGTNMCIPDHPGSRCGRYLHLDPYRSARRLFIPHSPLVLLQGDPCSELF